jgi:imidazolonepropionase-like amidohydrolase
VDEAHKHGLPVTAHAHAARGVANAVAAGVDGLEHVTFWTAEGVDAPPQVMAAIVERGIVVGATAGLAPPPPGTAGEPPPEILVRMPHVIANLRKMWESGAVVVAGTDAGIAPAKPHDVLRYAPPMMSAGVGMSPAQTLQIITAEAARVLGLGAVKGRLAAGYDGDLLAVRGDPTSELGALHDIEAVYVRGSRVR